MVKTTRYCPLCTQYKLVGQFYPRKGKPAGYCKECTKKKALQWSQKKRDKIIGIDEARKLRLKHKHFLEIAKRDSYRPGERTCRRCEKVYLLSNFYGIYGKPDSYCKACRLEVDKKLCSKSPASRMKTLISAARIRARNSGWSFNLTKEFLLNLWNNQNGLCYYTEWPMTYDGNRTIKALSIERIDSLKGYTMDNVVLCCRLVNEMKSNQTLEDFISLCRLIVETHERRSVTYESSKSMAAI